MKIKLYFLGTLVVTMLCFYSCREFLDAKPYNTLAQPSTLKDLRAVLDNEAFINNVYPGIPQMAADEFYMTYRGFSSLSYTYQNIYTWDEHGDEVASYSKPYQTISMANVVMEALQKIDGGDPMLRRQLEGEALFLRGWMFYQLAQVYCPPYSIQKMEDGLGLVLRLDSDSEVDIQRSSLSDTYERIINDLNKALDLLPLDSEHVTRPTKLVCYAALARIYLGMDDFPKAEEMAGRVLEKRSRLLDFNSLNATARYPVDLKSNVEIIYYGRAGSTGHFMANANTYIDPEVYDLYEEDDLRRKIYFTQGAAGMTFKGYYHGALADYFAGLALDEIYLIKAECLSRRGENEEGLHYLNRLREHRYASGSPYQFSVGDSDELLGKVLEERRRQLVCRGIRWLDMRRLNRDGRFSRVVERKMHDGERELIYTLFPNDLRYTFLIPKDAVEVGNYLQNPR